jgi:RNA polymerase sigma-70 factor (ECF subfamily)
LTENPLTNTPQTNALLALMCFQSSRIEARTNEKGEAILFNEQDKDQWDKSLIEKGNYFLVNATNGNEISKYHLEAGIAYWHTTDNKDKWKNILQLYNQLILIEYSPITALNRTFVFSKIYGHEKAILEADKLNLSDNDQYHALLGYLYAKSDIQIAIEHYEKAIKLTKSNTEKQTLKKEIERLNELG